MENNGTKIFLDFGISYSRSNEYFEFPLLQPSNIDDLLKTKLIPELEGLYRYYSFKAECDASGPISIKGTPEERRFDAILLSHAHMDHYGYIGLLREDIPIYLSKISHKIIELYSKTGRDDFHIKIGHLQFNNLKKNKEAEIGTLAVKMYDVDHSIMGASSYFIQGKKSIVYTGDFRLHGNRKHLTEEFLNLVQKENVDYLLCEGTRLGLSKDEEEKSIEEKILSSEEEVEKKCIEIVESEENLIIYDASQADIERVKILCEVAKKTGRELIIDSKKAFLLLHLNEDEALMEGLPNIEDFKILLGRSKLGSNTKKYKELTEDCPGFYLETFKTGRRNHERLMLNDEFISEDQFIWGPELRKKILSNSNEYIIYTSNGPLLLLHCKRHNELILGTYIYGKAEPFTEEMEFTFNRLLSWLKMCNLKLEFAHTSGHCFPEDLKKAIEIINPKNLIPIHTNHPEVFKNLISKKINIIMPIMNKTFVL